MNFENTKWDVSEWTEVQKIKFQEKAFELGFTWRYSKSVMFLNASYYFLKSKFLGYNTEEGAVFFNKSPYVLKTYEDMFPEETVKVKTPKWVTADIRKDYMDILTDKLTQDKDYKVLEVLGIADNGLLKYSILDDQGMRNVFHESWFYPEPTMEEILPERQPVIEEDTFEGLVYSKPELAYSKYLYIRLNTLSEGQLTFIKDNVPTDCRWIPESNCQDIIMASARNGVCVDTHWWSNNTRRLNMEDYLEVCFNDIFIKQEEE